MLLMAGCYLVAQPSMSSNEPSSKRANETKLRQHVHVLSRNFHPRNSDNVANLNRCADYIANQLRESGAKVEFQDYTVDTLSYRNVIGRFGVGKPKKIIVGAHYDSCGHTPGADDNASGVAGLLELARLIGKNPPDCEIEVVAYTLEEPPFFGGTQMGSAIHADSVASQKDKIIGVIVLEMIGYFSDERGSQSYPVPLMKAHYPSRGNFITVVSKWNQGDWIADIKAGMKGTTDLPVYSFRGPETLPGIDFSDHRNYWTFGYPALMINNTSFLRNNNYHQISDTIDTLDFEKMTAVVDAAYHAISHLGQKK